MTFLTFLFVDFIPFNCQIRPQQEKNVFLIENLERKIEAID